MIIQSFIFIVFIFLKHIVKLGKILKIEFEQFFLFLNSFQKIFDRLMHCIEIREIQIEIHFLFNKNNGCCDSNSCCTGCTFKKLYIFKVIK